MKKIMIIILISLVLTGCYPICTFHSPNVKIQPSSLPKGKVGHLYYSELIIKAGRAYLSVFNSIGQEQVTIDSIRLYGKKYALNGLTVEIIEYHSDGSYRVKIIGIPVIADTYSIIIGAYNLPVMLSCRDALEKEYILNIMK